MMNAVAVGTRKRWIASAVGAAVVIAAGVSLFRLPLATPLTRPVTPPMVALGGAAKEMSVRDPAPLFLPTDYNATLGEKNLPPHEPGKAFLATESTRLTFNTAELDLEKTLERPPLATLDGKTLAQATSADAVGGLAPGAVALGFGRQESAITPMPARGGVIEIAALATGKRVRIDTIPVAARPPSEQPWQPVEFLAAIDPAGLVGPLTVTPPGSNVEAVDNFLRNYLAKTYRVGDRLPPGFYRIIVAP